MEFEFKAAESERRPRRWLHRGQPIRDSGDYDDPSATSPVQLTLHSRWVLSRLELRASPRTLARMLLETPRLQLRRFTLEDAPFIFALVNSPGWLRYIGDRGVRTEADARGYLDRSALASYARHGFGLYHVAQKSDGASVGLCGLIKRDYLEDVDVGFAFLPEFNGRGYAMESSTRVLEHARRDFGCPRIAGIVQADNAASIRVLEKLGLNLVGPIQVPGGEELRLYRRDFAD